MGVIPSILVAIAFAATYLISSHPTADGIPITFDPSSYNSIPGRLELALQNAGNLILRMGQLLTATILSYITLLDPRPFIEIGTKYLYIVSERVSYALLVLDYTVTKAVIDTIYSVVDFIYTLYVAFIAFAVPVVHWIQSVINAGINLIEQAIRSIQQFFSWIGATIQAPFKIMGQGIDQSKPYLNFVWQAVAQAWISFYSTAANIFSGHLIS